MEELVQLERRYEDFAKRDAKLVVASLETLEVARQTKAEFPHLSVVADSQRGLASAAGVIHPESGMDLCDTSAPTTIVLDRRGIVRWLHRPASAALRLSPDEILAAIDDLSRSSRSGIAL